jgi:DNA-binding CsgD family transcriptional regulator
VRSLTIFGLCLVSLGWQFIDELVLPRSVILDALSTIPVLAAVSLLATWSAGIVLVAALVLGLAAFELRHDHWMTFASQVLTIGSVVVIARAHRGRRRQKVGREVSLHRMAAGQARITHFLAWNKGDLRMAQRTARQACELFVRAGDRRRAMLAAIDLAWIQGCHGDLDAQSHTAQSVLAWAERAADDRIGMYALVALGCAATQRGAFAEAEIALDRAIGLARSEALPRHERVARGFLGALKALEGRSYSEVLIPDHPAWQPTEGTEWEAFVLADWLHGDYRLALEREAAAGRPSATVQPNRDWILPFVAMAGVEIDQVELARSITAQLQLRYGGSDFMLIKAFISWAQGMVAWREEDLALSAAQIRAAATTLYRMRCDAFAAPAVFDLAEIAQTRRDQALTQESAEMLEDLAQRTGDPTHRALARAARAWISIDERNGASAVEMARSAAADLLAANYRAYSARTLVLLGQLLAPTDRAQAITHLESAVSLQVASGATWRLERCFALLRKLGHGGRRLVAQTRGPASLTKREREIIQLAVQGQTTSEIGRALFITTRTVETHLANSYAKLGLRSRLELMRVGSDLDDTSAG